MDKIEKIKSLQSTTVDSSSEEEFCDLKQKSKEEKEEREKEIEERVKEIETPKKYLEDFNLNEIYNFVDELDKSEYKDMNSIFKKEKEIVLLPDKNYGNSCQEILDICNKCSPFKPRKEPLKISLIGKIIINYNDDNNNKNEYMKIF